MNLENARVIVTGAASGLGRCFATEFRKAGAAVFAIDLNEEGLESLKEQEGIDYHVASVSHEEGVVAGVRAAVESLGSVNGLVNNAGIFRDGLLARRDRETGEVRTMGLDQLQPVIDVNLTGTFLCAREVVAHMIEGGEGGVIVNISSCSRHGNRGQTNYSATKAGVVTMAKLWAEELARHQIRVGAVAPGFADTPILQAMRPEMLEKMLAQVPLRRAARPEEIFQAVRFIFECDYFTGRCIDVDGGISM
jgi:3-oxoacyl-[acyl-carrier protein] reductase